MKNIISKKKTTEVLDLLELEFPDAETALKFTTPFELLVATILSAQCTDVRVNKVTEELFKVANTPEDIAEMGEEKLSEYIKTCGFFNTKSKNIVATSIKLLEEFGGEIPKTMEELTTLPGVGRKTADVMLSVAFGIPAIAVDTHVFRVTNRIGVVEESDVYKTEMSLMNRIEKNRWSKAHHLFILHGRKTCKARKPECLNCVLDELCMKKIDAPR